jgi:hypothetical protein
MSFLSLFKTPDFFISFFFGVFLFQKSVLGFQKLFKNYFRTLKQMYHFFNSGGGGSGSHHHRGCGGGGGRYYC